MSINKKSKSVFSTVINDLVRSAIGEKARQVPDQDLDSYVTELITNEARAKQAKYKAEGVRAYQPNPQPIPPSNNPLKPNKRFLMNIMKQTDSHNQAVIREAEENAKSFQQKLRQKEALGLDDKGKGRLDDTDTLKRKRKSDQDSDSAGSTDSDSESSDSDSDQHQIQYRGRGKIRNGSSMDKYFDDRYDATKDVGSDTDIPAATMAATKKKSKKTHRKHHSKSKKKKHRSRSSKKAKKDH